MLRKVVATACVVIGLMGVRPASAAIIADFNDPSDSYTIADVIAEGGIIVGDKLFSDFRVTVNKVGNANAPGADAITLTGVLIDGDFGLRFNGGWHALAEQFADTTIGFKVTASDPFQINGNMLKISGFGAANGGSVSVSENVYETDPNTTNPLPLANKLAYYVSDTNKQIIDEKLFIDPDTQDPVALTSVWVVKDIIANGGEQENGFAHLSEFYQTFSQTPEPASLMLIVAGGMIVMGRRRR